ncbi:hypothetical protein BUE76_00975 [Cnuella takakiae]|nr:hypothetical protein BUE76_00975 [Cnuella takakiae]
MQRIISNPACLPGRKRMPVQVILQATRCRVGVRKGGSIHNLRHNLAAHLPGLAQIPGTYRLKKATLI